MVEGCVPDLKHFKQYFGTNHSNYETREREKKGGTDFLQVSDRSLTQKTLQQRPGMHWQIIRTIAQKCQEPPELQSA
jgi:hypothetical protein